MRNLVLWAPQELVREGELDFYNGPGQKCRIIGWMKWTVPVATHEGAQWVKFVGFGCLQQCGSVQT
jgi:hypothetical protein